MRVLVTGATGFVGHCLADHLASDARYELVVATRRQSTDLPAEIKAVRITALGPNTDWSAALDGVGLVIHAAARAHVFNESALDPLGEFRRTNVEGTLTLARQAVNAGVRRFIFISSVGVNGNQTKRPFVEGDTPNPMEPYAVSKLEAEQGLFQLGIETGLEIVIIRPPLVYGPNAPGNFGRLIRAVAKGVPLPLGAIRNQRSFVAIDNLVNLIVVCLDHHGASNQIFLVSDGEDISTTDLLCRMGRALGRPARLISMPAWLLETGGSLLGKRAIVQRLCGSLQVDIGKARSVLGWTPPVGVDDALAKTARYFLEHFAR